MQPIALDYETVDSRGPSTDYFREDFRVTSVALTWEHGGSLRSVFYDMPETIYKALLRLHETQRPVIVHSLQFEMGVTMTCYPELSLNWHDDTARMCGLRDSGGTPQDIKRHAQESIGSFLTDTEVKKRLGLGLEKCASRVLPSSLQNHKSEAHNWLRENLGIKRGFGKFLHKLPRDILERYNVGDTEVTYELWKDCNAYFDSIGYSNRVDWQLYSFRTKMQCVSKIKGFPIDRPKLLDYIRRLEKEIHDTDSQFIAWCGEEDIAKYEDYRIWADIKKKVKREANYERAYETRLRSGDFKFNPNSSQQFAEFLMKYKGMDPFIYTKEPRNRKAKTEFKPSPSTKSEHMHQWGEAGEIMANKSKLQIKLNQAMGIYLASEYDGKWHPDIKNTTTATDRTKGGQDND